jgi:RNA polymerase subunit RPABC4/transcription elongation factor Spt4
VFLIGWPGGDLESTLTMTAAIVIAYLSLIWVATILWAYRDIRGRSRDPLAILIGISLVVLLPLVGIPLYLVLRPTSTLLQAYDRQLEQEAILSELHSVSACPNCRRPVQDAFQVCPHCAISLKEPCRNCGQLLMHAWRHCPFCATAKEETRAASRLEFDAPEGETGDLTADVAADAVPESARRPRSSTTGEPAT